MRYQRVFTEVWNDEKFTDMSAGAQRLFLYLLTCPHSNLIGLYILKNGYMMEDLDLSPQSLKSLLQEVVDSKMVARCDKSSLVFIPKYLKFNPLTNPNQVKAGISTVKALPKSMIINDFISALKGLNEGLNESLYKGLVSVLVLDLVLESESMPDLDIPVIQKEKPIKVYIEPRLGEHQNVLLTEDELNKLHEKINKQGTDNLIDELSGYMASTGKKYKSHYATILVWNRNKKKEQPAISAQDEKKRVDLKRDLRTAEEALKRAEETKQYSPNPENDKRVQAKQRDVNKLRKELDI